MTYTTTGYVYDFDIREVRHLQTFGRIGFAITLGDNFYDRAMESPSDPRWKTWIEDLYDPLGITFYASLHQRRGST